jgi:hypothetical protein
VPELQPPVRIRLATRDDVPAIIRVLADDPLGATRERYEDPLPAEYWSAWVAIERDPNQLLIVAEVDGETAGVLQLTLIPGLTRLGSWRALVEGARIDRSQRGAWARRDHVHLGDRGDAAGLPPDPAYDGQAARPTPTASTPASASRRPTRA